MSTMLRAIIPLSAVLAFASGAHAAAVSVPRAPAGGFSRSTSVRAARPSAPHPRGGPGTLGGYLQRTPSPGRVRGGYYPGYFYPGPYYSPFYSDPFYGGSFGYDPFFAGPSGYYSGSRSGDEWSKRGNVQLHVDPKDVEVIVDGIPSAKGGRAALDLPTGMHHIEIQRSGYRPWSTDLDVKQGIRYLLEQKLERLPKEERQEENSRTRDRRVGEVRLDVQPPDTIVDMDGRFLGMADLLRDSQTLHRLPAGRHKLRFSRPGYKTVEREVVVATDHPTEMSVNLEKE
jgi:hypothetical protein